MRQRRENATLYNLSGLLGILTAGNLLFRGFSLQSVLLVPFLDSSSLASAAMEGNYRFVHHENM